MAIKARIGLVILFETVCNQFSCNGSLWLWLNDVVDHHEEVEKGRFVASSRYSSFSEPGGSPLVSHQIAG
jgi:hypothetical protein